MDTRIPILGVVIALTLLAMYTDYRWHVIKNVITLPAIVLGLALNLAGGGWQGLLHACLGLLVGGGLMMIPFAIGKMGGGDVKLMAALGALLGSYPIVNIFFYTTIAGGVLAMIVIIAKGEFVPVMKKVWLLLKCIIFRTPAAGLGQFEKSTRIPYGLAIGAGTFCFLIAGNIV